jgi:hypothetical protein
VQERVGRTNTMNKKRSTFCDVLSGSSPYCAGDPSGSTGRVGEGEST